MSDKLMSSNKKYRVYLETLGYRCLVKICRSYDEAISATKELMLGALEAEIDCENACASIGILDNNIEGGVKYIYKINCKDVENNV